MELKNILIGLALGDLNIEKPSRTGHARLRFAQGLVHEEYLFHLFEKVRPYCRAVPYFPKTLHNVTGKFYPSIRFNTCTFACFDELYDLFYPEGKKILPLNIGELLTPVGLAYFIMDDGHWTGHGITLATNNFTKSEVELLAQVLEDNFDLKCNIRKDKNVYLIYISAKSIPQLRILIKDFMHPTMLYKLGL